MKATIRQAADGRVLAAVQFRRETPTDDEPKIEAVYQIAWVTDYTIDPSPLLLNLLSVTRMDTREPDQLLPTEMEPAFNAVAGAAAEYDRSLLSPEDP